MAKGKITAEVLQKVKDAVNIIEVVGEHVVLRKSGSNYSGLCPFHNERSPSFSVSEQKQLYHCYGCKKGGDLISFVQEIHALSFVEAIEELAERGKVKLPKDFGGEDGLDPETAKRRAAQREKTATAYKLNRFAAKFFRDQLGLPKQKHVAEYFKKRGVDAELSQNFYLGASPASWDALAAHLVAAKAPLDLAAELGLVKPSQKSSPKAQQGPGYFDLFRNRAMFPILDLRGKVVGFGGRGLPLPPGAPDVGDGTPKYLNSSESMLFQKSKLAYGLFQAQKHVREKDEIIIVEGYFDVLGLHAAGFTNAVATCGTSLTPDHLTLFKKFCDKITMLFDGDRAGITATDRAMEIGLQNGLILRGAAMPEGLDPDEVLFDPATGKPTKDGKAQMSMILASAAPLLDTRIDAAVKHAQQGAEAKTQALKQVAQWLAMYTDPVGKQVRMDSVVKGFGISVELLQQAMQQAAPRGSRESGAGSGIKIGGVPVRSTAPARDSMGPPPDLSFGDVENSFMPPMDEGMSSRPPERRGGQDRRGGRYSRQPEHPPGAPLPRRVRATGVPNREALLVTGLLRGGQFLSVFKEALTELPRETSLLDLAQHPGIRVVLGHLIAGMPPGPSVLEGIEDPQVRAIVSEALMGGDVGDGESSKRLSEGEFRMAVTACLKLLWARFSQQLKKTLATAEANKDANLHAELMKEYLDVQRRMKDFDTFYDEA